MSGYYLISRKLNDPLHELHPHTRGEPACAAFAWIDLIGLARWKETGGCPRGSVPASERFLATRWNWHRSRVTRFLAELEAEGRISREPQAGRKQGHITICNYDTYQEQRTASEPQVGPRVGPRTGPRVGPKRSKKEKHRKNTYTEEFEAVWEVHPRGPKPDAFDQYRKAVPSMIEHDELVRTLGKYVASFDEGFKGAHLFRWIRDNRWEEIIASNGTNGTAPLWLDKL